MKIDYWKVGFHLVEKAADDVHDANLLSTEVLTAVGKRHIAAIKKNNADIMQLLREASGFERSIAIIKEFDDKVGQ